MNWVFFDASAWNYDVATPLALPMGGSQSALCYLARALATRGHRVATVTGTDRPREALGVRCFSHRKIPVDLISPRDTISVVLNGPAELAAHLRTTGPQPRRLVLWTQHAPDQPAMHGLADPSCAALWDRLVCVSEWQRRAVHEHFGVPLARMDVLRNAVGPSFESLFADAEAVVRAKSPALRLAYTSIPYRGLDVLLSSFPRFRQRHPHCRLDVFSSMQVYGGLAESDERPDLYNLCRDTEGIHYHGSVPQPQLAQELAGVSVLAYPNTYNETSCIAVMEALAAGLLVVTSDLGALPETCGGWARLVAPMSVSRSREAFERDFEDAVDGALYELQADPDGFYRERFQQVQAVTADLRWDLRAAQWEEAALSWIKHA